MSLMRAAAFRLLFILALFLVAMPGAANPVTVALEFIDGGSTSPIVMAMAPGQPQRIYVGSQSGVVSILENGKFLPGHFLDIRGSMIEINPGFDDRGLLGLAFHPGYATNRRVFVSFIAASEIPGAITKIVIAELKAQSGNPDRVEPGESLIFEAHHTNRLHYGGHIAFGLDGYLYISTGDASMEGVAQDLNSPLGGMLRLDVDSAAPYAIPPGNPFVGEAGLDELWAKGLRNPWKFNFDRVTGELYCGDVGDLRYEEMNIIQPGGNYGWDIVEGIECYNPPVGCDEDGLTTPLFHYNHDIGFAVVTGFIYRGAAIPELAGKFVFADWFQTLHYAERSPGGEWVMTPFIRVAGRPGNEIGSYIHAMIEGPDHEIYIAVQDNLGPYRTDTAILKVVPVPPPSDGLRLY